MKWRYAVSREIKFRFWEKEKRKMSKIHYLGILHEALSEDFGGYAMWENIEKMQYTGLKDKKGKEIYEGDIVRSGNGRIWEIKFGHYKYALNNDPSYGYYMHDDTCKMSIGNVEVIGNKYQKPELLEEKK
jgi:uncharacterized phage protein (TIGR01671 family)